jgi:hypothetical protein
MRIAQGLLPYKIEFVSRAETVTAHAGLPLVIEAAIAMVPSKALRPLRKALGYRTVEPVRRHLFSLIALICAGGDHLSDLQTLRADRGLGRLLGFEPSGSTQAKDFLYRFHQAEDGRPLTDEDDDLLSVRGKAQIRAQGPGLQALDRLRDLVLQGLWRQRAMPKRATVDVDASIVRAHKKRALMAYEGTRGYQPQMAYWAELGAWLHDQFRDGNVPAEFDAKAFLQQSFAKLPVSVTDRRLRADSAFYNEQALSWADEHNILFAVSADMNPELKSLAQALSEQAWQPYRTLQQRSAAAEERQWAELEDFVPNWQRNRKKDGRPLRYLVIRVRGRQQELFEAEAPRWRYFAVVTNMDWNGERLLRWQREKQGTVEFGHGVIKNDLAGGVMPAGRFGANAAWWRLNLLSHNLLELIKQVALPSSQRDARPKTLRYRLLKLPGRLVRHARGWVLKLWQGLPLAPLLLEARAKLVCLAREQRRPREALPSG